VGAALVMALLAAIIPAHRLARLDPASAYRGA
jgi:ABC-type lipoprotein release transport system permease subunit